MAERIQVVIQGIDRISPMFRQVGVRSQSLGKNIGVLRLKFLAITAAVAAVGFALRNVLKTGIDFEVAFTGVRKTVDATEEEFAQLRNNFRQLALQIPITATEFANIGAIAGQLGIRGVSNLTKFTKTIALLGVTTDISGEQAALSIARFTNIMGVSRDEVDRLGSAVVDLGNNFAARESEIIELSKQLAAFGRQVGLSAQEVLAFSTIIKASGGNAQAAATAFQSIGIAIQKSIAGIGKDLKDFADVSGLSAAEFKHAFETDASGALVAFLQGLKRLDDEGTSAVLTLDKLGLADKRLTREIGKLLGNLDQLTKALDISDKAWRSNTALVEEAGKFAATTASKIKLLTNALNDLKITFFDRIGPGLTSFIEQLTVLFGGMTSLEAKAFDAVRSLDEFTVAIRTLRDESEELTPEQQELLDRFEQMRTNAQAAAFEFQNYGNAISFAKDAAEAANRVIVSLNEAVKATAAPTVLGEETISQVERLKESLGGLNATFDDVFTKSNETFTGMQNAMLGFGDGVKVFLEDMKARWGESFGTIGNVVANFTKTSATAISTGLGTAISNIILGVKSASEAFKEFGKALVATIVEMVVQYGVQLLVAKALSFVFQRTITASSVSMAAVIANAWAPAAALVSLATLGANAAAAIAGIAATAAVSSGIAAGMAAVQLPSLQAGGIVTQPTVALIGEDGPEAVVPLDQAGGFGTTINVNIDQALLNSPENIDEFVEDLTEQIGRLLERRQMMPTGLA